MDQNPRKNIIIVPNIGNRPYLSYTKETMEVYAQKYGHDLKILTSFEDTPGFIPEKFKNIKGKRPNIEVYAYKSYILWYYLQEYDRCLYLDDTCFITSQCPDIFSIVPREAIGGFDEGKLSHLNSFKHDVQFIQNKKQLRISKYLNTGVLCVSKCHVDLFNLERLIEHKDLLESAYPSQAYTNYMINKNNIPIHDLGISYNYLISIHPNDNYSQRKSLTNRELSKVLHQNIIHVTGHFKYRSEIVSQISQTLKDVTNAKIIVSVLNYARPKVLKEEIIPFYLNCPLVSKIIISHAKEDTYFDLPSSSKTCNLKDYDDNRKYGLFRRYTSVLKYCTTDCVLFVDDDICPDLETMIGTYLTWISDPNRVYGISGRNVNEKNEYIMKECTGQVDIVLTQFAMTSLATVRQTVENHDLLRDLAEKGKPLWNGEDIFLNYIAKKRTGKKNLLIEGGSLKCLTKENAVSSWPGHLQHRIQFTKACHERVLLGNIKGGSL